jgi:hypothetical protein
MRNPGGEPARQAENGYIVFRQAHHQPVVILDLGVHGYFLIHDGHAKVLAEKTISLQPIRTARDQARWSSGGAAEESRYYRFANWRGEFGITPPQITVTGLGWSRIIAH